MKSITEIIKEFEQPCSCGREHRTAVQDVQIGSGLVKKVGEILKKNGFPKDILLVADKNTLAAAKGIEESLRTFRSNTKYTKKSGLPVWSMSRSLKVLYAAEI